MAKVSAGILLYRRGETGVEVFLVHPGGPFWKNKDLGAWSIPKGEYAAGEEPVAAALREFEEETGIRLDGIGLIELGEAKQAGGKVVSAWAVEGDCDAESIRSNTFPMEWPPKSGKMQEFPEVDRAGWFGLDAAEEKILARQRELLDRLKERLREVAGG